MLALQRNAIQAKLVGLVVKVTPVLGQAGAGRRKSRESELG